MSSIFVFNPDHELALANNDKNFKPKQNIVRLTNDLETLPLWLNKGHSINESKINEEWKYNANLLKLKYLSKNNIDFSSLEVIDAWGWNKSVINDLLNKGANYTILPTNEEIDKIRELTQRKYAVKAMSFLNSKLKYINIAPETNILTTIDDIIDFAAKNKEITLKSPLSESGKGIYFCTKDISNSILGWIKKTIKQQGYIIAEKRFNVIKNFALEFEVKKEQPTFIGYSLFETNGKAYTKNILLPDSHIESHLNEFIPIQQISECKELLMDFIATEISPYYKGFIGIDMFVFEDKGTKKFHPCVEINLRPTMGLIAHQFYNKFVEIDKQGEFCIDFFNSNKELVADHKKRSKESPTRLINNRISKGYLSLCPITEETRYRARVEIF